MYEGEHILLRIIYCMSNIEYWFKKEWQKNEIK